MQQASNYIVPFRQKNLKNGKIKTLELIIVGREKGNRISSENLKV